MAENFFQALLQLIIYLEEADDRSRAIRYALRGVRVDPLREEVHRELMRLYLAAGHPAAALDQFRELTRILKQELGCLPAASTQEIAQLIARKGTDPETADDSAVFQPLAPPVPPISDPGPFQAGMATLLLTDIEGSPGGPEREGQPFTQAPR